MGSQRKKKPVLVPLEERRCIIYTRVSSKDQAQEGWSLDAQMRLLRECARAKGFAVALELVEDETAKKPGRREFSDMIRAVKRGVATEIVVEKVDRLYLNFKDPVEIDELMQDCGLTLHFAKDLWQTVQDRMEGKAGLRITSSAKPEFAYRGLVRCGQCRCLASPYRVKGHYTYYACTGAKGYTRAGVREECITEAILFELEGLRVGSEDLRYLKSALKAAQENQREDQRRRRQEIETEREKIWQRLDRLYLDRVNGEVPTLTYSRLKPALERELADLDTKLRGFELARLTTFDDNVALLEAVSNSAAIFQAASPEHRRKMLGFMVSNCEIIEKRVCLTLRPWFKCIQDANLRVVSGGVKGGEPSNWWAQLDSN